MRLHHVNNLNIVLAVLKEYNVKLIGINANSIADGDQLPTIALCWNIIYRFQVVEAMKGDLPENAEKGNSTENAEKALLEWCQNILKSLGGKKINSFQPDEWKDGYALNGIIHYFQPNLFNMEDLFKMEDVACLENAIHHAKQTFGVEPIFLPNDMISDFFESKSLVIYISQLNMALNSPAQLFPSLAQKDETRSKVEKAIFDELQFLLSKHDSTLLQALQNPTLKDLKKRYRNYNIFFKELEAATERIGSMKVDYENVMQSNVSSLDKENLTLSFEKLMNTYKTLQSNAQVARNAVQSKLVEKAIFDELQFLLSKHDSTLLQALQNPTLKDLMKRYRNYNVFFKDLEAASKRIVSIKVGYEYVIKSNVANLDKENVTFSFRKLMNTYKTVQSKLISRLIEQFDAILKVIKQAKHDHASISKTLSDKESLLSEVQEKILLCEKTIAVFSKTKPFVKLLNDLSEQLSLDQSTNELDEKKLRTTDNVQNDFEVLIISFESLLERSLKVLEEKKNKDKMKNWLSGIQSLQTWLQQSLKLKIDFSEKQIDSELNKIKACLFDVHLKWKEFLKLTTEWNETLCNIVKNNDYAVMQEDVQKDFTDLHKMLVNSNNHLNELLEELQAIENVMFLSWEEQANIVKQKLKEFDPKEEEVQTLNDAKMAADVQREAFCMLSLYEADMNSLFIYGNDLLKNKKLGEEKSDALNKEKIEIKEHWDMLNMTLSTANANLYAKISRLLDDKKEQIATMLGLLKDIIETWINNNNQSYKGNINKIKELVDQLSKLEKPVLDLFEHSASLNKVTIVTDNDKLVVMQNCDDLLKEYEDCAQLFNETKKNQQNATLQFITKETESVTSRLKEINQMKDLFNEDFQTDKNLRQYYSTCQNWLSKIEKQKENLEELNGFVNEICIFLPNEAKLIVDNAFENVDHSKTIYENEFKRFNVLMMQLLNKRLQLCSMEIKEITQEVTNLEKKEFNSFEEAASLLINLKNVVYKGDQIKFELKVITDLLNELKECGALDVFEHQRLTQQKGSLSNEMQLLSVIFFTLKEKYFSFMNNLVRKKLDVFSAWLPNIKKQSYENIKINASDITVLKSQLKETENVVYKGDQIKLELNMITDLLAELKESGSLDVLEHQMLTQQKGSLSNEMLLSSSTFITQKKMYLIFMNNLVCKKHDVFSAFLPNIKKQSYENIKINASDITDLKIQLNETEEIEKQISENSFSSILTNKYVSINDVLNESLINEVNFAVVEWNFVDQWANKRKELLLYGLQKWEEFVQCKKDLLDFLQENEKELLLWNQLDLNDKSNIASKLNLLENITDAMQRRRENVINFNNVADDLLAIVGNNMNVINNILSQVAVVHDIWNRTVKNSIGYSKKLQKSRQMVIELEQGINVVDTWLTLTSSLLEIVTENIDSAQLEAILIEIKEKGSERNEIKKCLESVRDWYAQLDGDDDTRSRFSVLKSVKELNEQFTDVIEKIDNLNNIKRKGLFACFR